MKNSHLLMLCALGLAACQPNEDNNKPLDYESLDVNFSVKTTGFELQEGSQFGIGAWCSKDGQEGAQMGTKTVSAYKSVAAGETSTLVKVSDEDAIVATSEDHNFRFSAVYPYVADADFSAFEVELPAIQKYEDGVLDYLPFTATKNVISIVPTVELDARTPFAVLNLSVPVDIVKEGTPATLKQIVITPAQEAAFAGALAGEGTIDVATGEFTLSSTGQSKGITLDFPQTGLKLTEATTKIAVAVLPFTVPEGGFSIEFTDLSGDKNTTAFLNQDSDKGANIGAGTVKEINVTGSGDGVVPVRFPVKWLIGTENGVHNFRSSNVAADAEKYGKKFHGEWMSEQLWYCEEQPHAWCQWNKGDWTGVAGDQWYEAVNTGNISTPGVKGVWTGDNWEFIMPVKNFAAGTKIEIKFPIYGREQPVFWYIKYLDGEEWKTQNLHNEVCYDGTTAMNCTFSMKRGAKTITEVMTFENEVKSGYIKVKIECADGSIQAKSTTAVEKRVAPWVDGGKFNAPYYFWDNDDASGGANANAESKIHAISFTIVD